MPFSQLVNSHSLSSHLNAVVLYLGVGPCENVPTHTYWSFIVQVLFRELYCHCQGLSGYRVPADLQIFWLLTFCYHLLLNIPWASGAGAVQWLPSL